MEYRPVVYCDTFHEKQDTTVFCQQWYLVFFMPTVITMKLLIKYKV